MLDMKEITSSAEERVLTGVKAGQAFVLDGLKNMMSVADRVVPEGLSERLEDQVEGLPKAAPMVEGYFEFAGKLLEAQRDFVGEVVEIFQPAPAPKKAAAKKTTKKAA